MRPLVGSHRRLGGVHWAVGWGSPEKKLGEGGGLEGWAGAAADRRWGVVSGRAGRPRAAGAGGSAGGGWRLRGWSFMINWRPLISYPTAGKSNDQR